MESKKRKKQSESEDESKKCCMLLLDQFRIGHNDFYVTKPVTQILVNYAEKKKISLNTDQEICDKCYKKIYDLRGCYIPDPVDESSQPSTSSQMAASLSSLHVKSSTAMDVDLNVLLGPPSPEKKKSSEESDFDENVIDVLAVKKCLRDLVSLLGMGAIDEKKLPYEKYQQDLAHDLINRLSKCVLPHVYVSFTDPQIIVQLKEKFNGTTSRDMKVKVLSVIPKNWSMGKIQKVFGKNATKRLISNTKELVERLCGNF